MKSLIPQFSKRTLIYLICWLALAGPAHLIGQPIITPNFVGCNLVVTTSLPEGSLNEDEPSTTLFYRLDGKDATERPLGSYYWDDVIDITPPSVGTPPPPPYITKTLSLPNGKYNLVCYQVRKNGPLKSVSTTITVNNTCRIEYMPSVLTVNGSVPSALKLENSWNVSTYEDFFDLGETHKTIVDQNTLEDPWLFITLTFSSAMLLKDPIKVTFDSDVLAYKGAISDNYFDTYAHAGRFIESVTHPERSNYVEIQNSDNIPANQEAVIHLIFKKLNDDLDTRGMVTFTAESVNLATTVSLSLLVRGTPHDPNSLTVNRKQLCSCQQDEILTYQVDFQNKGTGEADNVRVELSNTEYLDLGSVDIVDDPHGHETTAFHHQPVTYHGSGIFIIKEISLRGLRENNIKEEQTRDRFWFRIRKADCLSAGDVINPRAKIIFRARGTSYEEVHTDYARTDIINNLSAQKQECKNPDPDCDSCDHRRCWLRAMFSKKKK